MPCGICTPLIDEKVPAWASSSTEEIVLTTCRVLNTVSVVVLISLHTRFVIRAEPALMTCVLRSEPLIDELPFILSVDTAGSYDQSASVDIFAVVAIGIPLSNSSPPTALSIWSSRIIPSVDILEQKISSNSPKIDDMLALSINPAVRFNTLSDDTLKVLKVLMALPPPPITVQGVAQFKYTSCEAMLISIMYNIFYKVVKNTLRKFI
jgi:hypothetical protein